MSDPLSDNCVYCGSSDVLDDAWFCDKPECWAAWQEEERLHYEREQRIPLSRDKARVDLMATRASVWGSPFIRIEKAVDQIVLLVRP